MVVKNTACRLDLARRVLLSGPCYCCWSWTPPACCIWCAPDWCMQCITALVLCAAWGTWGQFAAHVAHGVMAQKHTVHSTCSRPTRTLDLAHEASLWACPSLWAYTKPFKFMGPDELDTPGLDDARNYRLEQLAQFHSSHLAGALNPRK